MCVCVSPGREVGREVGSYYTIPYLICVEISHVQSIYIYIKKERGLGNECECVCVGYV